MVYIMKISNVYATHFDLNFEGMPAGIGSYLTAKD
jgi:hypothetical protein